MANLTRSQFAICAQEATTLGLRCMRQAIWLALLQRQHDHGGVDDFVTVAQLRELDAVVALAEEMTEAPTSLDAIAATAEGK